MLQLKDTDWLNGYKNKTHIYICYLQETHFRSQDTYRLKVRMEKYIPRKWEAKESWNSNPHIRQNRPENKEDYKR